MAAFYFFEALLTGDEVPMFTSKAFNLVTKSSENSQLISKLFRITEIRR